MPCYLERTPDGGMMFMCGDLGPHCAAGDCDAASRFLCDYPVGKGQSCDLPLCSSHAYAVAHELHYCPGHMQLWAAFLNSGRMAVAMQEQLGPFPENVLPFLKPAHSQSREEAKP